MTEDERRLRRVLVSPEALIQILQEGTAPFRMAENPLPEDASIVRMAIQEPFHIDPETATIVFFARSSEFDPVPEGTRIPDHPTPSFRRTPRRQKVYIRAAQKGADLHLIEIETEDGAGGARAKRVGPGAG